MSRFVDTLNRIRQSMKPDWMTPSQRIAYDLLRERLRFLDEVNLWGGPGVGKTFLGWVLHIQGLAIYMPLLARVEEEPVLPLPRTTVVVDNLGWRRGEVRQALHLCRSKGYEKVILITSEPAQEQMAIVELQLTEEDIEKAKANLLGISVVPYRDTPRNLWDLVSPTPLWE